ncbi:MAG: ribulokinase [Gemmatimonadota bacterium]|nr:ribulokinase [Gemmatimonadota bacterium]HEU4990821.1 ribulokinase [Gemmatimonadaceae bacterium]
MALVAGVDFGTQSVRVSIVDSARGPVGTGVAEYPVIRNAADPDFATQSHAAHMDALAAAMRIALGEAGVSGHDILSMAVDTTGSTVIPVDDALQPLDDYYLWCDHRAKDEAALITEVARRERLPAIEYCGGVYSSEWGFAKLLHWLRHNPDKRSRFATALEHCDMVTATLCGVRKPDHVARSVCAMGHKWLWNAELGGLPSEEFLTKVDPLLAGVRAKLGGRYETSDKIAGHLSPEWAERLGLRAGIPIPVGAFDAHWDALGAGVKEGDVVNVVGTSTCIVAVAQDAGCIPGLCGVVRGSVDPAMVGIEAGLSAVGDVFEAIARRAGASVRALAAELDGYRAGQTGLLRLVWDNGDRTVLVNARLGGVTLGWNLTHTPADELFAAIEGTAFHTRIVLERMAEHGTPIARVIQAGGVPQKNPVLNQVYANVMNKPMLVPERPITSLGSALFAFLAAGVFGTIAEAQQALCPPYREVKPDPATHETYERLFAMYRSLYFGLGAPDSAPVAIGEILPALREIAARARG